MFPIPAEASQFKILQAFLSVSGSLAPLSNDSLVSTVFRAESPDYVCPLFSRLLLDYCARDDRLNGRF
jgi:hypothetical protein